MQPPSQLLPVTSCSPQSKASLNQIRCRAHGWSEQALPVTNYTLLRRKLRWCLRTNAGYYYIDLGKDCGNLDMTCSMITHP